jgi:hypothetical protein
MCKLMKFLKFLQAKYKWGLSTSKRSFKSSPKLCGQFNVMVSVRGDFWGIIGQNPSVSKSNNRLHVVIFWIFFINSRFIPQIRFTKWVIFLKSFWASTGSSITSGWFSPFISNDAIFSSYDWFNTHCSPKWDSEWGALGSVMWKKI